MKPSASTLAVAASVALAAGLIILLAMHLPVTPSTTGMEADATAAQDPTIALPSIATSDLARRVKLGEIQSIEVVDQHAIVTTEDGQPRFVVSISPGSDLPDVLRRFGVTPDELSQVDYVTRQPPLECAPGELLLIFVPLVLFGAAVLYVWRSSAPDVASLPKRAAQLRQIRSHGESKRPAKSAA